MSYNNILLYYYICTKNYSLLPETCQDEADENQGGAQHEARGWAAHRAE